MNIPTIRSRDKINIMVDMELTDIHIDEIEPTNIIKCRSRDKINDMISLETNQIEKTKKVTNDLDTIDEIKIETKAHIESELVKNSIFYLCNSIFYILFMDF